MLTKFNFFIKHKRKLVILTIIAIVLLLAFWGYEKSKSLHASTSTIQQTAVVRKGNISVSLTGSGIINSATSTTISSEVTSTVNKINYNVGDYVYKDYVLMELDKSNIYSSIDAQQKTINKTLKSISEVKEQISNLNIKNTKTGYVKNLQLNEGSYIGKGSTMYEVYDDSTYKIESSFYYVSSNEIKEGDSVDLFLLDSFNKLTGTVTHVQDYKTLVSGGRQTYTVEISVNNPGYNIEGLACSVTVYTASGSLKAIETGHFEIGNKYSLSSPVSGTVEKVNIKNGDYISINQLVATLENSDLYDQLETYEETLTNNYSTLSELKESLNLYDIKATCNGVITNISVEPNSSVKSGTSLASLIDTRNIEFDIEVDELDISKIKVGQTVNVSLDAITESSANPFIGTVKNISIEGTSSNGVTSFPVTISLEGDDNILIGMNANAEIVIESKENILILPVEAIVAIRNKKYVRINNPSSNEGAQSSSGLNDKNNEITENMKEVTVGIYNEDYIEIISGLSEGDTVILPTVVSSGTTSTQNNNQQIMMNNGMMPNMNGGGQFNGGNGGSGMRGSQFQNR